MLKTRLEIEIETKGVYSKKELEELSEQIVNFLAGPKGSGLVVGTGYGGGERTFEISNIKISLPKELIWTAHYLGKSTTIK